VTAGPLASNPEHLQSLCERLALGRPEEPLAPVAGGFHHRMWRLRTGEGKFAIKQLAPDAPLAPGPVNRIELAESAARAFASRGLPAVCALRGATGYLQQIGETGYLVYPWVEACARRSRDIRPRDAVQVAQLLARMHSAGVSIDGLAAPAPAPADEERLGLILQQARRCNVRHAALLEEYRPAFAAILAAHRASAHRLDRDLVVSHGDLDHKNILWDARGAPRLIDWESARRLHPTYELLLEALEWSGLTHHLESARSLHMLAAYRDAGGRIDIDAFRPAMDCILADWLSWLLYNLGRATELEDAGQRALGVAQVELTLPTLLRLHRLAPGLLQRLDQACG
jgi:hypothetical protein